MSMIKAVDAEVIFINRNLERFRDDIQLSNMSAAEAFGFCTNN
jgi:hypothetical protein